jgi:hypothetical protein
MQRSFLLHAASAALLASLASAQAPDIIHYTFDSGDATNSATGTVPDGIPAAGVGFGPGICGGGAHSLVVGATCQIDTGWTTDLGTGDWTVGMWLDRTASPIALTTLQYIFGNSTAGGMRCFVGGIAGTDGIVLRAPANAVTLPGGGALRPVHVVFCYDSVGGVVRGYLDGTLGVTTANAGVNILGTGNMTVMRYNTSTGSMGAGYEIDDFRFYRRCLSQPEIAAWFGSCGGGPVGTSYCTPAVANSTGNPAAFSATGSASVAANNLVLEANSLPNNAFGFFLTSLSQGSVPNAGGSQGTLCLGGSIGRYVGPGQIQNSGVTGSISLAVDLTQHPTPIGPVSVAAGETWNFQAWFRDSVGGAATSNFTDGYEIDFVN